MCGYCTYVFVYASYVAAFRSAVIWSDRRQWIRHGHRWSKFGGFRSTVAKCVLVLILRTGLFVNVRTSSLVNSVHQIIYYVVWYMAGSDWREFWIDFSVP